ncbi:MAG TPA: pyridoxamine 5'-phosphate oxidase family protein [Anaerolineales bacterium]|nr:pyridoxamine 5'-phosphate oxidase family protein [Anaerolineales bacterium]HLE04385.1 pyridoxamine 5'-phosphate oxidase family protein [Anaerolineales bacterium]
MPSAYGIQGPSDGLGLLPWDFLTSRFEQARNYWVVTASADGVPAAVPVWGLWHENAFFFSTDPLSRKGRNIATTGWAVIHLESGDEAAIIEGRPELLAEARLFDELDALYFRKYAYRLQEGATYRLRPMKALAWMESDFTGSATRWRFEE